ncbi:TetR/AcrR family transcriptional regulator [Ketogulonicigenium vulgare]|nr:TetR/AcrR family transcriptional regulator [Ketogulonicigenium vulgare]ADO41607.1 Transcriptional regulator [Ketogulonicigenium vulgare Y25]ALJ80063.1 TetR family transcriptional regulator [Ketogulonicigenium vulgare]AOZ53537.1 transcriptional regulator [Ketogulonicigenium vulgare]
MSTTSKSDQGDIRPKRGRPPAAETAAKRRQIIEAATEAFAQQGFNAASFAAIAERVGMTLPGLLHYFPRKTDLLLAILEDRDRATNELIADAGPSWAANREGLRKLVRRNVQIPHIVQMFSTLNSESLGKCHPARDWFEARSHYVRDGIAAALRHAQDAGEFRKDFDPDVVATEVAATMDGLQVWWLRMPDRVDLIQQFDDYLDRLDRSLAV